MLKKTLALSMSILLFTFLTVRTTFAETKEEKFANKVKANLARLKTGPDARIEVKLKDKRKIKGYVSATDEEQFTVVTDAGENVNVSYSQVKQAKGNNLSQKVKFAIFAGVLLLGLALLLIISGPKS